MTATTAAAARHLVPLTRLAATSIRRAALTSAPHSRHFTSNTRFSSTSSPRTPFFSPPALRCSRGSSLPSPSFLSLSSPLRSYSTLPVLEHHVPRQYPFPVILTTELIAEEDLDLQYLSPHDLPPYKSTLTVNLHDLPLTAGEKRIFRHLVGARMFSVTFRNHPIPSFLHGKRAGWSAKGKEKTGGAVKFVSRHLPSAEANENRVFQLLDECVRQSKVLAKEMEQDGEWVEMGEDEFILMEAKKRMQRELWEERQKKRGDQQVEGAAATPQLTGDTAGGQNSKEPASVEREKVRVPRTEQRDE